MLLAPMVAVVDSCILLPTSPSPAASADSNALAESCTGPEGSAAQLVESTLARMEPRDKHATRKPMGYTLPAPLLQLFKSGADGWAIDIERVQRVVRTIRDTDRPVVLYLFATHFATDAPLEQQLAKDATNLAQTRDGPMAQGRYYDSAIHHWTFATTQTELTARRVQAAEALLAETCLLPEADRTKIQGITLLGELHHLFPDFEAGMGFNAPYRVTDYSEASRTGFRAFLRNEFQRIDQLNRVLGSEFVAFEDIEPPTRDIRAEPLTRYTDHIDAFAHGTFPVSGWAYSKKDAHARPAYVHVYLNGKFAGKTPVDKSRQDVLAAKPEFGTANTGWRLNLDFRPLSTGVHKVDVFLESRPGQLTLLGSREIAVMDKTQSPPLRQTRVSMPPHDQLRDGSVQAHIDQPVDQASYYYNPLVPLWHAFRGRQVADYLKFMDQVVARSCLSATPRYTHQIIPFTNPSWDENKFAIDASLSAKSMGNIRLGVSLYGEASYGASFAKWYSTTGHRRYGITEFHPLKAMSGHDLGQTLDQHAQRGADFLSFFVEPYWLGRLVTRSHNLFSFDPSNAQFGSDRLYQAVKNHLVTPETHR
ncbi:hypothetical protein [Acidovorax sp.]|uniref:hypothetical protein n=1 Tax=Acidovorax sp. TaxID=1872122 RepID=UPI00391CD500